MRLSLVSLVVLSYSASATQLCTESNRSENTSLSDVNSSEGLSCVSGQNGNVRSRSGKSIAGNNVIVKRSSVQDLGLEIAEDSDLGQSSEIAEENEDPNDTKENSSQNLKALDNDDLEQNRQGMETGCGDSTGEVMKNESKKRDMKRSCGAQKSANSEKPMAECSSCKMKEDTKKASSPAVTPLDEKPISECSSCKMKEDTKKASSPAVTPLDEKPIAECSSCKMKEDAMKKEVMKEDTMKKEVMKDEKPMAECNSGCSKKEDTTKSSPPPVVIPPVDKSATECSSCNKKEDTKKEDTKKDSTMKEEKPIAECNSGCSKKEDTTKASPPPVVIPPVEKPMTECNVCNKKEDAKKASPPPPVVNPPTEKPIAECNGNSSCNKKDGASKPPLAPEAIPPPAAKSTPPMSAPMSTNSTVVIVVENHIAPCSVCQEKAQGGNNLPKPGPVPTGTPKVDAKPPPPPQPQPQPKPETKSDSKSALKPEIKPEVNPPKAPVPSSAPKSNTEKTALPIFTGDAITANLRSTTLNIVLLLSLFTTLLNLGGNVFLG